MINRVDKRLLVFGVSAVAVAAASAWIPFLSVATNRMSVVTAHGLCSVPYGGIFVGGTLNCTAVNIGYLSAIIVGACGLAAVVPGIISVIANNYRHLLTPAVFRLFVLLVITGTFAFWGYTLLSQSGNASPAQEGTLTSEPLTVSFWSGFNNLHAVIVKVLLKNTSLSIDLRVTAPENSKISEGMEIDVYEGVFDPDEWSKTLNVPPGSSSYHFDVPLTSCYCYEYRSPYLLATGVSVDDSYADGDPSGAPIFNLSSMHPSWTNEVAPVIEQEVLDLSDTDIGGGVFNLSTTAYPSAQQIGPAEWQWQDVSPSDSASFTAESVSGGNDANNEIFQAGIILGVAGAAFILIVDHGFDMWSEARKRKEAQGNRHIQEQGVELISARGTAITITTAHTAEADPSQDR